MYMKEITRIIGISLLIIVSWLSVPQLVHADVDWTIIKELNLGTQPLDIAASGDGQLIFVLVPGEILVYSISDDKVTNRIPVGKVFDRLTHCAKTNVLILTSSSAKALKMIQVEMIHDIALSGLPIKGPEDAPITIAVFSDYQ